MPQINLLRKKPKIKSKRISKPGHGFTRVHKLITGRFKRKPAAYSRILSREQYEIMKELQGKGILTERMLPVNEEKLSKGENDFRFLPTGTDFKKVLKKLRKKPAKRKKLIEQAADFLARLHNIGILHGHAHTGNFAVTADGRVFLREYDMACRAGILRENKVVDTIMNLRAEFQRFYEYSRALTAPEKEMFIDRVISQYKVSDWLKSRILDMVKKDILI